MQCGVMEGNATNRGALVLKGYGDKGMVVKMNMKTRSLTAGITMPQLLVVIGVLAVVVLAVAIPNLVRPRSNRQECINNLKVIAETKRSWTMETQRTNGSPVDVIAINSYLKNSAAPMCPQGGKYSYNPVGKDPTCSLGATLGHTL